MNYFNTLPRIATIDYSGNAIVLTNLMVRAEVIPSLLNNPLLFYSYDVKNDDTPEIIASKYYGDPYRYWIVLFGNQLIDPQWNWPMNSNLLTNYIIEKYKNAAAIALSISVNTITNSQVISYTQATIKNYVKTVTTTDSTSLESKTTDYYLDLIAYNDTIESEEVRNFTTGAQVTEIITKSTQTIYDYEILLNESRRSISLVNSSYVSSFESQFYSLMNL
jgi:hypothetical protein